jgi:uncharacterized membrane protein
MISALLLSFALAQEPAVEAAPAVDAATVVAEEPKATEAPAAPEAAKEEAVPSNEVKLPLPQVVEPKSDAEAVKQTEQAFDALVAGEWAAGLALLLGVAFYVLKKFKGKKADAAE